MTKYQSFSLASALISVLRLQSTSNTVAFESGVLHHRKSEGGVMSMFPGDFPSCVSYPVAAQHVPFCFLLFFFI